eukprot:6263339-Pyramimonas_sp.AAC.1
MARADRAIASGLQPRSAGAAPLVPEGVGPRGFLEHVTTLERPMCGPPTLHASVEEAYRRQAADPEVVKRTRLQACALISEWANELEPEREAWAAALHPDVRRVIGHLHGPLLKKLVSESGHLDKAYFDSLCSGRPALGAIQPAGLWRAAESAASVDLQDWIKEAPERNRRIVAGAKGSGDAALDQAAWSKIANGAVEGPFSVSDVDLADVAVHPSFP